MEDPLKEIIEKYLEDHPEVREVLEVFQVSLDEYSRAVKATSFLYRTPSIISISNTEGTLIGDHSKIN